MLRSIRWTMMAAASVGVLAGCADMGMTQKPTMGFFVTSSNPGTGGNFGGLQGADRHCQALASAAGAGGRTWRAYLSQQAAAGQAGINARDRIGKGPWRNAKGIVIANDVAQLHASNAISKSTALTESGMVINGRGDSPNRHDVLTGSQPDGSFIAGAVNTTCGNWTQNDSDGSAMVGHHDRTGSDDSAPAKSWNSSHQSRGCSIPALKTTGGDGLLYCFAAD